MDEILDDMIPFISKKSLATSTDVFCDVGAFSVDETRRILDKSLSLGLPVRVHGDEILYTGISQIAAKEYNALSVDHLLQATENDFTIISNTPTIVNFMPTAPFGLFVDTIPRDWNKTSVKIGLGSDFNPNNWTLSMQTVLRMAVFRYYLHPIQAFRAATSGSYQSITGNKMELLSIKSKATFVILNGKSLEEVISKLGQNLIADIYIEGKRIIWNK